MALAMAARCRLRGKQRPPAVYLVGEAAASSYLQALGDEAWSDVTALSDDARRKHMHWVHVRNSNPNLRQPSSFTRDEFWAHTVQVYKDV